MSVPRAVWWALAVVAAGFAVSASGFPAADVSLSCAKIGELHVDAWDCDDSIGRVWGVWPLALLGLLLTTPPLVAALAMRVWVSWLAVAALAALSVIGLANWSSYWWLLIFAAPVTAVGFVVAALQQVAQRRQSSAEAMR